ncbi:acyl-CoA thioesterase [Roseomonas terrae]|uniref:Acyl-CoA thioesterase n=1 Tax=Neoroseomonas terrae TaxID=424799 RepID=A0ABS5EKU9_9PROT|nr:acyl-CoA thioesterase [Neoroseomonas terrae]MBR0651662.1 acyl-CoA thioesterase [Neoroseomonas terrae]
MDAALRERFGVEGDWALSKEHTIRWAECDIYAHVNHAAYLTLFEDMRIDWWLGAGGGFSATAPGPVVGSLEVKYHRPGKFQDRVLLTARTVSFRRTSFVHQYAMWRDGVLCSARALCVVVDNATGLKAEIADPMRRLMAERDGAVAEG